MHQNGASSSNGAGLEADRGAWRPTVPTTLSRWLRVLGRHRMCRTVRVQDVLDHSHPQSRNRQRRWYRGGFRKKKHLYSCRLCLCGVQNKGRLASWIFGLWIRESP